MGGVPLVEGVITGHQDRKGLLTGPARPTCLLAERRDGAREAVADAGIEPTDVDAQLQGIGGGHPQQLPAEELGLDGAPLRRQVPATVRAHGMSHGVWHQPLGPGRHQLGPSPAPGERDGAVPVGDETGQEVRGGGIARHRHPVGIGRRVPDGQQPLTAGRAVIVHAHDRSADQVLGQRRGRSDGGRRADEHRGRPVQRAHPAQPAKHVGDMGAEDAPVRVQLVHHHVAQTLQERCPSAVVREKPLVQHVRVGEDAGCMAARPQASVRGGVAVVGHGYQPRGGQRPHRSQLVLGQRLGGEQQQRRGGGHRPAGSC